MCWVSEHFLEHRHPYKKKNYGCVCVSVNKQVYVCVTCQQKWIILYKTSRYLASSETSPNHFLSKRKLVLKKINL